MMQKFFNNWTTTLSSALAADGYQIGVPSALSDKLVIGDRDYCLLTLLSDTAAEVVKVNYVESGILYVDSRGVESTTPIAWPAGSRIMCSITAGTLQDLLYSAARPALVQAMAGNTITLRAGDVAKVRFSQDDPVQIKLAEDGPFTLEISSDATSPRLTFLDSRGSAIYSGEVRNVTAGDSSAAFDWEVDGEYGFSLYPKGVSTIYLAGIFNINDLILYQVYGKGEAAS